MVLIIITAVNCRHLHWKDIKYQLEISENKDVLLSSIKFADSSFKSRSLELKQEHVPESPGYLVTTECYDSFLIEQGKHGL